MTIQEKKFVVKWDVGEVPFSSIESANRFIDHVCQITAPNKEYEVVPIK